MALGGNRDLQGLVGAQLLGAFNDNLFKQILLLLAALRLFPGEDQQGIAFAVFSLPFVVFSGLAGDLSERFSKRTVIVYMKVAEIGVMALGALAFWTGSWPFLLVVLFLMGTQSAFFGPSKYGVIPEVAPGALLLPANGVVQMTTFLGILIGTALAGPLLDVFGDRLWISGAVCTGFAALGTLSALRMGPLPPRCPQQRVRPNPFGDLFRTIGELRGESGLLSVVLLNSFFWFNGAVLTQAINGLGAASYLAIADDENRVLSFMQVTLAVCVMIGCLLVPAAARRVSGARLVRWGAAGMVIAQSALWLIGPVVERAGGAIVVGHVALGLAGFAGAFFVVPVQSYIQHAPPDGSRGKTFAVNNFLNFLFMFLAGAFYFAVRAAGLHPALAGVISGAALLGWLAYNGRAVRRIALPT